MAQPEDVPIVTVRTVGRWTSFRSDWLGLLVKFWAASRKADSCNWIRASQTASLDWSSAEESLSSTIRRQWLIYSKAHARRQRFESSPPLKSSGFALSKIVRSMPVALASFLSPIFWSSCPGEIVSSSCWNWCRGGFVNRSFLSSRERIHTPRVKLCIECAFTGTACPLGLSGTDRSIQFLEKSRKTHTAAKTRYERTRALRTAVNAMATRIEAILETEH